MLLAAVLFLFVTTITIGIIVMGSRGSVLCIATRFLTGRSGVRVPVEVRYSSPKRQPVSGAHPDSYSVGVGVL